MVEKYRGYHISHWAKPVPTRAWDYDFSHEDYDGAPDSGDHRCGAARSLAEAKEQIDEQIEEEEDDREFYKFQEFVRENLESWGVL